MLWLFVVDLENLRRKSKVDRAVDALPECCCDDECDCGDGNATPEPSVDAHTGTEQSEEFPLEYGMALPAFGGVGGADGTRWEGSHFKPIYGGRK